MHPIIKSARFVRENGTFPNYEMFPMTMSTNFANLLHIAFLTGCYTWNILRYITFTYIIFYVGHYYDDGMRDEYVTFYTSKLIFFRRDKDE